MLQFRKTISICFVSFICLLIACSKGGDNTSTPTTPPATGVCASRSINISVTTMPSNPCGSGTGSITVTATGSTGFTYSIDGGSFQASNVFQNVTAGNHTISAKDGESCTGTSSVNVPAIASGPLFASVKAVITANCVSCHGSGRVEGGANFSNDCSIVNLAARIKARAVDGNPSFMPQAGQLSAADKKKITDWITAGGKFDN